jgi:hypothetical protein
VAVQVRGAKEARHVGSRQRAEPDPEDPFQLGVQHVRVNAVGGGDQIPRLRRDLLQIDPAQLGVGVPVALPPQVPDQGAATLVRLQVQRVELALDDVVAGLLQRRPSLRLRLVGLGDWRASKCDRLAVELDLQSRLPARQLGGLPLRRPTEVAVDGEMEEIGDPPRAIASRPLAARRLAQRVDRLAREQLRVRVVDALDRVVGLLPGEVEVVLAIEIGEELLGSLRVAVDLESQGAATIGA